MDKVTKTTGAILVDYDLYETSQSVRNFVYLKAPHASMIALVSSPEAQDPDSDRYPHDWDIVIRNVKGHPDHIFKLAALHALQEHSNVYPAVAVDLFNREIYEEAGVLVVWDGDTVL